MDELWQHKNCSSISNFHACSYSYLNGLSPIISNITSENKESSNWKATIFSGLQSESFLFWFGAGSMFVIPSYSCQNIHCSEVLLLLLPAWQSYHCKILRIGCHSNYRLDIEPYFSIARGMWTPSWIEYTSDWKLHEK